MSEGDGGAIAIRDIGDDGEDMLSGNPGEAEQSARPDTTSYSPILERGRWGSRR